MKTTCDRILAATALLSHGALVALDTEDLIIMLGETRPCERL